MVYNINEEWNLKNGYRYRIYMMWVYLTIHEPSVAADGSFPLSIYKV